MQRIPGNSHQPSINPNYRRLQPVASSNTHHIHIPTISGKSKLSLLDNPTYHRENPTYQKTLSETSTFENRIVEQEMLT